MTMYTLKDITRPSGGFAMLAVDQREAMRLMFAAAGAPVPVTDQHLTDFKVNAAKILSPYASAILVDQQFCYRQIVEQQAVAKSCAMIVAADEFIPGNGIPVDSVVIDKNVDAQAVKRDGGKALKLLVLWRSDEDPQQRLEMVKAFNTLCHSNGLLSIIEPVVRPPRRGAAFTREQAIIDAARELGDSGADLYKVEMPLFGKGTQQELLAASQKLNAEINMDPDYPSMRDAPVHSTGPKESLQRELPLLSPFRQPEPLRLPHWKLSHNPHRPLPNPANAPSPLPVLPAESSLHRTHRLL